MGVPECKRCTKCGETKPLEEFNKRSGKSPDGRQYYCKPCNALYLKERYAKLSRKRLDKALEKEALNNPSEDNGS